MIIARYRVNIIGRYIGADAPTYPDRRTAYAVAWNWIRAGYGVVIVPELASR